MRKTKNTKIVDMCIYRQKVIFIGKCKGNPKWVFFVDNIRRKLSYDLLSWDEINKFPYAPPNSPPDWDTCNGDITLFKIDSDAYWDARKAYAKAIKEAMQAGTINKHNTNDGKLEIIGFFEYDGLSFKNIGIENIADIKSISNTNDDCIKIISQKGIEGKCYMIEQKNIFNTDNDWKLLTIHYII